MNIVQLISHKRDGGAFSESQIRWIVEKFTSQLIAPEQMSALAMAIFFQDMSLDETVWLTQAMIDSGRPLEWTTAGPRLDKHSTGGVGDKISLPLAPLLAELGIEVPMISGRGLGPTGGTLDKLESIPGIRVDLEVSQMQRIVEQVGCVIASASQQLAPADRKLYALRDVTGTVPSVPLITASILSKKLSEGLDGLVMDVKWGNGAFMKTLKEAEALAQRINAVAKRLGVRSMACLTDMNQPLGRLVGNHCEVLESLQILQGQGPPDVRQLTIELAAEAQRVLGMESDLTQARRKAAAPLDNGNALERFRNMVASQGGDLDALSTQMRRYPVVFGQSGFVTGFDTEKLGYAVIEMGGGRKKQGDKLNLLAGLEVLVKVGDPVDVDQPWCNVVNFDPTDSEDLSTLLANAIQIADEPAAARPLITAKQLNGERVPTA